MEDGLLSWSPSVRRSFYDWPSSSLRMWLDLRLQRL